MDDTLIGRTLGQCQLVGMVATDDLGTVYEALDVAQQVPRMVRVLPSEVVADPEAVGRLEEYARIARALPEIAHVPRLVDAGEADGRRYLVTESVGGQTLAQMMSRVGAVAPRHVVTVLTQLGEALDALHAQGLLHGDLRPENVAVSPDGQVSLLNTGLARALRPAGGADPVTPYVSPEVLAEGPGQYGLASEVYALGQTVYALLAGSPAFTGDADALRQQVPAGQVPPLPESAAAVDAVVRRAVATEPEERWPSAGAFAAEFRQAVSPEAAPPPPPPTQPQPAKPGGGPVWLWILIALALIVAAAWLLAQRDATSESAEPTTTPFVVPSRTPEESEAERATRPPPAVELTASPVPGAERTPTAEAGGTTAAGPQVTFAADPVALDESTQCTTLTWRVDDAESVYLSSQGQPELEVGLTGQREDCLQPGQVKTTTLRAVAADGATTTQQVTVVWP